MNPQSRRLLALGSLIAILLPGAIAAASTTAAESSSQAAATDSARIEPGELERLLFDKAFNTEASTDLTVDGRPVLTDPGFMHVPAADFKITKEVGGGASGLFNNEDGFVYGGNNFFTEAVAAVHLPQGVTVDLVLLLAVDDSTHYLTLSMRRKRSSNLTGSLMAHIETDSDNSGVAFWLDDTIVQPVIDNGQYQYYLIADNLTTEKKLRSVFIYYHH